MLKSDVDACGWGLFMILWVCIWEQDENLVLLLERAVIAWAKIS